MSLYLSYLTSSSHSLLHILFNYIQISKVFNFLYINITNFYKFDSVYLSVNFTGDKYVLANESLEFTQRTC